ncbi:unnamed protein product, partial [Ixodes hexagonus]
DFDRTFREFQVQNNVVFVTKLLEITKMELNHNHEVSDEVCKSYPESRHLTIEERDYVQPLVELNVLPSMIVQKVNEKTGE